MMGNKEGRLLIFLAAFAYILMVVGSEKATEPSWQILTRTNFSTEILQHDYVLVMVTVPWSGESRALMTDIVQLMQYTHGQFENLRLMLIYRNVEKLLGDVLVGSRAIALIFYRQAVPYKYGGKLSAQNILASVWHAMTVPSSDLPLKQLDTSEDLDSFLQSTDKAVVLFEFCGWAEEILASQKTRLSAIAKTKYSLDILNQEETLERDEIGNFARKSTLGSQLKLNNNDNSEAIGGNDIGGNRNTETSPKSVSSLGQKHLFASEQGIYEGGEGSAASLWKDGFSWASYGNDSVQTETNMTGKFNWKGNDRPTGKYEDAFFHGSSCTLEEYRYFEDLFTNLTRIARDNMLPPERQRFGLLSNRTVISALGLQSQQPWSLMLQFPECPNCSKIFNRQNNLEEFVLMSQALVTELEGEGYKLVPPLSVETPSLILFIDRASPSVSLRQNSKAALQALRQVALHYVLSYQPDKSNGTVSGKSLSSQSSNRRDRKKSVSSVSSSINPLHVQVFQSSELSKLMTSEGNLIIQVKTTQGDFQIVDFKRDGDLLTGPAQEFLDYLLQQKKPAVQFKEDALGLLAKQAGLQLLSSDFPIDEFKLFQTPKTLSLSKAKATGQTEFFEGSRQSADSQSYQNLENSPHITDNIPDRPILKDEKQVSEIGSVDINLNKNQKGYKNIKYSHAVAQDSFTGAGQQHCSDKLSIIEALDRHHDKQVCKAEMIKSFGDQFFNFKGTADTESEVGEYLLQKSDIYDDKEKHPEIMNVEKKLCGIQGVFVKQQERTVAYTGNKASFEKHIEDSNKLQEEQDQDYSTEKHSADSDKWDDQQDRSYATEKHSEDPEKLEDEQDRNHAAENQSGDSDKLEDQQDQNDAADMSFFFMDDGDQLREILSSDATIPLVVIINPLMQVHYVFPRDTPVTYSSLLDFINSFLNGTLQAHKHSEPFPRSPREPPRPPFVNRDFHEVDSIPRVTVDTFSRLVLGFDSCNENVESSYANSHHPGAAWRKDVLVLFSNNWCGFCMRLDLVVREVHRMFKRCTDVLNVDIKIASDSSAQDEVSFSAEINEGKSMGDPSKDKTSNVLPSIFRMDCTLNDCSLLLNSFNQRELYPVLLLFPAGKKDAPVPYEGEMSVNKVIEFLAAHGTISSNLYGLKGILWNKMQKGRRSLNTCAPRMSSSTSVQFQAPLQLEQPSHGLLLDTLEQIGGSQIQTKYNDKSRGSKKATQKLTVGSVLIATEKLRGVSPFDNSIIMIVKADPKEGFQGLVVNKPLSWDVLPKMDMQLEPLLKSTSVYFGGPLITNGMPFLSLTHLSNLEGFLEVIPGIYFGGPSVTSGIFDIIKSGNVSAQDLWFFLGFVSWGWQQLFDELAEQTWHVDTYRENVVHWPTQKSEKCMDPLSMNNTLFH